jgi:pimeloyl-ACP methyl ester carboxylesterase
MRGKPEEPAGVPLPAMSSPDRVVYAPDGTLIGAWRSGNGPPMVLVHGSADDHTAWDLVAPRLAMRFEVYAVDRRGRGGSPWSGPVYMIEQEFDDVAAFVDSTGTPTWLFGHGYGADVAIGAALRTRNLAGLILYEPAPGIPTVDPAILVEAERRISDGDADGALTLLLSSVLLLDDQAVADLRAHPGWAASLAMVETMPRELRAEEAWQPRGYNDLVLPTLLLVGSASPDWARRWTSMAQSAVPNSRLLELDGQGHLALTTAPDRVAEAVTDFVFDPSRS